MQGVSLAQSLVRDSDLMSLQLLYLDPKFGLGHWKKVTPGWQLNEWISHFISSSI